MKIHTLYSFWQRACNNTEICYWQPSGIRNLFWLRSAGGFGKLSQERLYLTELGLKGWIEVGWVKEARRLQMCLCLWDTGMLELGFQGDRHCSRKFKMQFRNILRKEGKLIWGFSPLLKTVSCEQSHFIIIATFLGRYYTLAVLKKLKLREFK